MPRPACNLSVVAGGARERRLALVCPGAYKDIDQVMANQQDLVEVVHTLRQVVCVKG